MIGLAAAVVLVGDGTIRSGKKLSLELLVDAETSAESSKVHIELSPMIGSQSRPIHWHVSHGRRSRRCRRLKRQEVVNEGVVLPSGKRLGDIEIGLHRAKSTRWTRTAIVWSTKARAARIEGRKNAILLAILADENLTGAIERSETRRGREAAAG